MIHEIKQLPELSNNPEQLLIIISTIEAANNDLRYVDLEDEPNNSIIMSMIEQYMSTQMHDEWIKLVIKTPKPEKFETLLSFLQNWKIRIEYQYADIRLPNRQPTPSDKILESSCLLLNLLILTKLLITASLMDNLLIPQPEHA